MNNNVRRMLTVFVLLFGLPPASIYSQAATTYYACTSSILSHFNSATIPAGSSIWFSAALLPAGTPSSAASIVPNFFMITFGQQSNGLPYECRNYPPVNWISFVNSSAEPQLTYYTSTNSWKETIPLNLGGGTFLAGCTIPPCSSSQTFDCIPAGGLPGNLPVTFTMAFASSTTQSIVWHWSAAVYSQFAPCSEAEECQGFGALGVKAVDNSNPSESCVNSSSSCSTFSNSDNAGTPENFKQYLIPGAFSTGGTNYTGTYTAEASCTPSTP